jgi:hypothetical protein
LWHARPCTPPGMLTCSDVGPLLCSLRLQMKHVQCGRGMLVRTVQRDADGATNTSSCGNVQVPPQTDACLPCAALAAPSTALVHPRRPRRSASAWSPLPASGPTASAPPGSASAAPAASTPASAVHRRRRPAASRAATGPPGGRPARQKNAAPGQVLARSAREKRAGPNWGASRHGCPECVPACGRWQDDTLVRLWCGSGPRVKCVALSSMHTLARARDPP